MCEFLPVLVLFYSSDYFWTVKMGYQHPMPFLGIFIFFATWIVYMCSLLTGILFPSELWRKKDFKAKIRAYFVYEVSWFVLNLEKDILTRRLFPERSWNFLFLDFRSFLAWPGVYVGGVIIFETTLCLQNSVARHSWSGHTLFNI